PPGVRRHRGRSEGGALHRAVRAPDDPPGGARAAVLPVRVGELSRGRRPLARARRDHGADLPRPARRDRDATVPRVRRARHGAGCEEARDRAPLLGCRQARARRPEARRVIAAVYRGDGKLVAEEWPRPTIAAGEVLLRVLGCGLCGSDIAKIVDPSTPTPLVLSHELVGENVALGPGVTDCAIGERAVAAHHVPCGDYHYCRRGSESM